MAAKKVRRLHPAWSLSGVAGAGFPYLASRSVGVGRIHFTQPDAAKRRSKLALNVPLVLAGNKGLGGGGGGRGKKRRTRWQERRWRGPHGRGWKEACSIRSVVLRHVRGAEGMGMGGLGRSALGLPLPGYLLACPLCLSLCLSVCLSTYLPRGQMGDRRWAR